MRDKGIFSQDWQHLFIAGGLVAAVVGTLVLAAALQVSPEDPAWKRLADSSGALPPTASPEDAPVPVESDLALPAPSEEPPLRVQAEPDDLERLRANGGGWTLQYMVTCSADRARSVRQQLGGDPRLYLLPVVHEGRPCQRICWGNYRSREQALSADSVPASMQQLNAKPIPRRVADLVP